MRRGILFQAWEMLETEHSIHNDYISEVDKHEFRYRITRSKREKIVIIH